MDTTYTVIQWYKPSIYACSTPYINYDIINRRADCAWAQVLYLFHCSNIDLTSINQVIVIMKSENMGMFV